MGQTLSSSCVKWCCREAWSQQVTNEQKQLAQETVESHKSLEAARTAELTARKAALEFEARASLAFKEVCFQVLSVFSRILAFTAAT